jgi:hypothetical protein
VQGAFWYDTAEESLRYFGDELRVIAREGVADYVDDYLKRLNDHVLACPTLFEHVQQSGQRAASLNFMWRRGDTKHEVDAPWLLKLLPGVEFASHVDGPDVLFLGDFVATHFANQPPLAYPGGPLNRFGFNDRATAEQLHATLRHSGDLALVLAYFPDNDFHSHDVGPHEALTTVQQVDQQLADLFQELGGLDEVLAEWAVVVAGDHGHNTLVDDIAQRDCVLDSLVDRWRLAVAGQQVSDLDELVICPNMRAAQVTLTKWVNGDRERVIERLLGEERIDQVIYRDNNKHFCVHTADRGSLCFAPATGPAPQTNYQSAIDPRGQIWFVSGQLATVGAELTSDGQLAYNDYPDALGRIANGSPSRQSSLWLTAKPGYEFTRVDTTVHKRGSHGSLHVSDSRSVLITAGLPESVVAPAEASIADVAALCRATIGTMQPSTTRL